MVKARTMVLVVLLLFIVGFIAYYASTSPGITGSAVYDFKECEDNCEDNCDDDDCLDNCIKKCKKKKDTPLKGITGMTSKN